MPHERTATSTTARWILFEPLLSPLARIAWLPSILLPWRFVLHFAGPTRRICSRPTHHRAVLHMLADGDAFRVARSEPAGRVACRSLPTLAASKSPT